SEIRGVRLIGNALGSQPRGHLVSFTLNGSDGTVLDPLLVSRLLAEQFNISSRAGLHCAPSAHRYFGSYDLGGAVRLSVSWFTEDWMIERCARAVAQLQAGL